MFIQGRVLGTFVGQAIGAGHREMAGVWLQVSLACLLPLALVPLVLWSALTAPVLSLISPDPALTGPGSLYAGVLASALPGRVLFSQLSQYLTAQAWVNILPKNPSFIQEKCLILGRFCPINMKNSNVCA